MKRVCVLGLGYVGLPTASILATNGFEVLGVDVDQRVVDTINSGNFHIEEPGLHTVVKAAIGSGNLRASTKPEKSDVFLIAVTTPLSEDKKADMSYVAKATERISRHLESGNLVILESTSPPGTCRNLVVPIIEKSGLKVGQDVFLAYSPQRVLPGKTLRELIKNDRVIGGYGEKCARKAMDIYESFVDGEIFLTDVTTAEMVKVTENTFRDVNIALANETALMCEKLGINFGDVARLSNRQPRVNVHAAGPGVGGHGISADPWFLVEHYPEEAKLIHQARQRNDSMPEYVVNRTMDMLSGIDNPKVAVLGLAFKGDVDDVRESPSLTVIKLLEEKGVSVAVNDPYVTQSPYELQGINACCVDADCLLLLTDHNDYTNLSPRLLAKQMRKTILFDTRNILDHDDWREANFLVNVLGVGKE